VGKVEESVVRCGRCRWRRRVAVGVLRRVLADPSEGSVKERNESEKKGKRRDGSDNWTRRVCIRAETSYKSVV
jgi:hypothetical protein